MSKKLRFSHALVHSLLIATILLASTFLVSTSFAEDSRPIGDPEEVAELCDALDDLLDDLEEERDTYGWDDTEYNAIRRRILAIKDRLGCSMAAETLPLFFETNARVLRPLE